MKFEVSIYPFHGFTCIGDATRLATDAEGFGYDAVSVPDHIAYPAAQEDLLGGPNWEAVTLASHLCSVTERVNVVFEAIVLPMHNPVQLARQMITLDAISAGRIQLGLAIGWLEEEFDILGHDFATRGARFDEYLQVMFRLWAEGPASFDGRFFRFTDVSTNPRPVQTPRPFIWIGSTPPRDGRIPRSLKRAAAFADGWMPAVGTLETLTLGIDMLRDELVRNGRQDAIAGYEVFQRLEVWNRPEEVSRHIVDAGGVLGERFDGNLEQVLDYVGRAEQAGITQISVEFPVESLAARFEAVEAFAKGVIAPLRGHAA